MNRNVNGMNTMYPFLIKDLREQDKIYTTPKI
jgi:hypothetical protein